MATEKFFVFNEDGALKRLKGRIVRFLDNEDPTGSDKSAIRTSLEVSPDAAGLVQADVGTAPNEIPVNGMLGDMAFQSSDGVSMGDVEAESLEVTGTITSKNVGGATKGQVEFQDNSYTISGGSNLGDIRHDAPRHRFYSGATILAQLDEGTTYFQNTNVGINQGYPSSFSNSANDLVVGDGSGHRGVTIVSGSGSSSNLYFADGTSGDDLFRGYVVYNHGSNSLLLGTDATTRWLINSSGNLAATGAYGIDFGQATPNAGGGTGTTGTPQSSVLSDYETGSWTPSLSTGAGESITYATQDGAYTKIGRRVICTARIYISSAATYGSYGHLQISGLPFVAVDSTDHMTFNYGGVYNLNSLLQVGDITGAQAQASGGASFYLQRGQYGGTSDVYYRTALLNTTGYLLFTVSYHTTA